MMDSEELLLKDINKCAAANRVYLLSKARKSLADGDELKSIYYQTEAFSLKFEQTYGIVDKRCVYKLDSLENKTKLEKEFETEDGISGVKRMCSKFPKEWTVIQLCKEYSPDILCSTSDENLERKTAIHISLLNYTSQEDNQNDPILIHLAAPEKENIFQDSVRTPSELKNILAGEIIEETSAPKTLEDVDTRINDKINKLKVWISPWICLFVGKPKEEKFREFEREILEEVSTFCIASGYSKRKTALISLIARRLDLLEQEGIFNACTKLVEEETDLKNLFMFLNYELKPKFSAFEWTKNYCFPCILIVDEMLDHFLWEMLNVRQEFCRISSLKMLFKLFQAHEDEIKDGYLNVNVQKGHVIIDPEGNLPKMKQRLELFYNNWLPKFNYSAGKVPSDEEFKELLNKNDVFIYNGHGNGLQFFNEFNVTQINIKTVTFLFGCDSVRLSSEGLHSGMVGSHLYYNIALCPAVVGALWVLTDFYTDVYSKEIIGAWIPTNNPEPIVNYSKMDLTAWKKAELAYDKNAKPTTNHSKYFNKNLLQIMCEERRRKLPLRIRCAFVLRGLPVINSASHHLQ